MSTFGGTPDYIDALTQDQRIIMNQANLALTNNQNVATFYCGGLSHILFVAASTASVANQITWMFDFGYDPNFNTFWQGFAYNQRADTNPFVDLIPCAGTYGRLRVLGTAPAGTNWNLQMAADTKGDNSAHLMSGWQLMPSGLIAVGAGATVDTYTKASAGGMADLWWRWSGAAYTLTLNGWDNNGNVIEVLQYTNTTAPADRKKTIILPKGHMNVHIVSGDGAAQSMSMSLIKA